MWTEGAFLVVTFSAACALQVVLISSKNGSVTEVEATGGELVSPSPVKQAEMTIGLRRPVHVLLSHLRGTWVSKVFK